MEHRSVPFHGTIQTVCVHTRLTKPLSHSRAYHVPRVPCVPCSTSVLSRMSELVCSTNSRPVDSSLALGHGWVPEGNHFSRSSSCRSRRRKGPERPGFSGKQLIKTEFDFVLYLAKQRVGKKGALYTVCKRLFALVVSGPRSIGNRKSRHKIKLFRRKLRGTWRPKKSQRNKKPKFSV